jgi:DNA-binding MarR family transcriptional regulator
MEAAGWLQRSRASDDERRVLIHLQPAGKALRARARGLPLKLAAATGCSTDEVTTLTRELQTLRDQLRQAGSH